MRPGTTGPIRRSKTGSSAGAGWACSTGSSLNCRPRGPGPSDRGYDADWFRAALIQRGITPCIPSKANRKHDRTLYRHRHRIENMFGRLKDWRHIQTRYDRFAHTFMSGIAIAATVIFWL